MAPFIRIGFIRTVQYENEGRHKGPIFTAGDVYECARDFGERWTGRGDAVELKGARSPGAERWLKVDDSGWTPDGQAEADLAEAEEVKAPAAPAAPADPPPPPAPANRPPPAKT